VFLSYLPHNPALYRAGGWRVSDGPGSSGWKSFLLGFYPRSVLRAAYERARLLLESQGGSFDFRVVTIWEADYPRALAEIFDPPPALYINGQLPPVDTPSVAVVGTRNPLPFTGDVIRSYCAELKNVVIVSGLARGVDRQAHLAQIQAGLPGVAVLGTGIDIVSPPRNRDLPRLAEQAGVPFAMVTEFPPGTPGYPGNFPRRNRIIAGLAAKTILIQAPFKSGAMITARFALEEGRDVAVFDHELFAGNSNAGGRELLGQGAELLRVPGWESRIVREPPFPAQSRSIGRFGANL
jgi:DNA processing protein